MTAGARPAEIARVRLVLATSGGGVGRHVVDLAAGLRRRGVEVVVAGPRSTDVRFGFTAAGLSFAPVEISDRPRPLADARAVLTLRRLCRDAGGGTDGAGVVHAHGLRAGSLAVVAARTLPRRRRPRLLVTLHNALVSGGRIAVVHGVLERLVARGADVVLVVSGDLMSPMRRLNARRVERGLVPAPDAGPPVRSAAAVRAQLGIDPATRLLLTVARLAPQKGLEMLADALERLGRDRPDLSVVAVVAGDGPLAADLAQDAEARRLPLRLLGRRDDVPDLLAAADVVVVPSLWEGQPLAVQEALRAGAAIVATDAGGTAEVAGDGALLVPPGDPAALAAALAELLDDEPAADHLRARARARAAALPTADDAVNQVMELYRTGA